MKIAIIGADGQVGTDLQKVAGANQVIPLTHADIEVTDYEGCRRVLTQQPLDVIINTAAFHQTDLAEDEYLKAFQVNAFGPRNLALVSREMGATLVHLSTDYVFGSGKREPHDESCSPSPVNAYGISKVAGEQFIRYLWRDHSFIVRTSGLFGTRGSKAKGGKNFIENVLEWAKTKEEMWVVNDQRFSPTYTLHLAQKIFQLLEKGITGIVHITNSGDCTWFEFAQAILKEAELLKIREPSPLRIFPTTTEESGAHSRRPGYSVLGHGRLKELGLDDLPHWKKAVEEYLKERV